jgi:hypothetical protein
MSAREKAVKKYGAKYPDQSFNDVELVQHGKRYILLSKYYIEKNEYPLQAFTVLTAIDRNYCDGHQISKEWEELSGNVLRSYRSHQYVYYEI